MSNSSPWGPSAELSALRARAELNQTIRDFFRDRGVLEVEVPLMARHAAMDPHIDSLGVSHRGQEFYLQTSPEYFMKRLLAAGSGDIYQLGKAFRAEEEGRQHNSEFTLLEWYRCGYDDLSLMAEVEQLVRACLPAMSVSTSTYGELFQQHTDLNPHDADVRELMRCAHREVGVDWVDEDRNLWLDLLMTHMVEPAMPSGLLFVTDYPVSHAALARITQDNNGYPVARRFEVFLNRMELANGYWELCNPEEQRARFLQDQATRTAIHKSPLSLDERLLSALDSGLPDCAGVALGVDRLLMQILNCDHISNVLSFDAERC